MRPNRHPFLRTLAVQAVLYPVAIVLYAWLSAAEAEEVGRVTGRSLVSGLVVLVGVGLAARAAARRWTWWHYLAAVLVGGLVVGTAISGLSSLGAGSA